MPRGLRSFDEDDADFFLELLPGPRDRDGLPDSIQFWKRRIEQVDADLTFKVGLIYGPSGCGKSSLVKAGILPRLGKHVLPVYIEATPDGTEGRLHKGLRKTCPGLPRGLGLVDSLVKLRKGRVLPPERKVLLVLDQFEQWLHANRGEENTELVAALRHCDGEHVQAIVLVRDTLGSPPAGFMRDSRDPISLPDREHRSRRSLRSSPCEEGAESVRDRPTGTLPEPHRATSQSDQDAFPEPGDRANFGLPRTARSSRGSRFGGCLPEMVEGKILDPGDVAGRSAAQQESVLAPPSRKRPSVPRPGEPCRASPPP